MVALIGDNSAQKYPFSQGERCEALSMLGIADAILLLTGDEIEEVISEIKPLILVLGNEYKDKPEIQQTLENRESKGSYRVSCRRYTLCNSRFTK